MKEKIISITLREMRRMSRSMRDKRFDTRMLILSSIIQEKKIVTLNLELVTLDDRREQKDEN